MSLFSLFCIILVNPLTSSFPVDIGKTNSIDVNFVDANDLTLWKVSISTREKNGKYDKLKKNPCVEIVKEIGGGDLGVLLNLLKEHIHIIVQLPPPATTSKSLPMRKEDTETQMKKAESKKTETNTYMSKTLASLLTLSLLQSPVIKVPFHKFNDHDQALNSLLKVAHFNYQGHKSPDHKDNRFILIPRGIGIGIIQTGWELKYLIPKSDKVISSVQIAARMAEASGLVSKDLSDLSETNVKLFCLPDVIYKILKCRPKSVQAIIIHFDEEIGSIMHDNNMTNKYHGRYFIIPICTSTSAIDIHSLPTEHTQELLELRFSKLDKTSNILIFLKSLKLL
ncbi:6605_t:CDS:2 [Funneliformis geosporum]|uniref:15740_t:CDS:1 n=1 Tax=Funneliformis geosporum TaxID=1117311 RepID=A0A9W4X460_9GLOM|nr:15740_t:CDS:2 [Funneliformis geosporum]CAI2186317.1 6605_t:CDS:2 [Funneliformis geosporum]